MWFSGVLLKWYDKHGRHDLPWQTPRDPYRVWISEIMLQQTQVSTVIPYFEKFMAAFPDVHHLAKAPIDTVLKYWAGLGYYARGRNLHKAAQILVEAYQGKLPRDLNSLIALPGIGASTAAAILAQSYGIRATILDGNVKRVLSRFHAIAGWPGEKPVEAALWQHAQGHTPHQRLADYTQAIMDLGATLCTRTRPQCPVCPLKTRCLAHAGNNVLDYPGKAPKKTLPTREVFIVCLLDPHNKLFLEKRADQGIWGGLWSFPEYPTESALKQALNTSFNLKKAILQKLPMVKHSFTHYHLQIHPRMLVLSAAQARRIQGWITPKQCHTIGLPAPIRKIVDTQIIPSIILS